MAHLKNKYLLENTPEAEAQELAERYLLVLNELDAMEPSDRKDDFILAYDKGNDVEALMFHWGEVVRKFNHGSVLRYYSREKIQELPDDLIQAMDREAFPQTYAIAFISWPEVLDMQVDTISAAAVGYEALGAAILYEMTDFGFEWSTAEKGRCELLDLIDRIDRGVLENCLVHEVRYTPDPAKERQNRIERLEERHTQYHLLLNFLMREKPELAG